MRPFLGAVRSQSVYEACIPFKLKYPYKVVKNGNVIEEKVELFPDSEEDAFVDEAKEIEIATTYKFRPVVIISSSETSKTHLVVAITKRKDDDSKKLLAICNNQIVERHFLSLKKYSNVLKYDSYVLVDAIYLITEENIYYCRGRLENRDFDTIRAKLKGVLSLNPPS